ncbi:MULTISPECIES: IclR family transcriptional regulator [unclassified Brevibacterium]|uniref:IclR family transcriptional regulator n=1 Tax=unclassified Brevibacterium TaxID=2614124 RepID=UPI00148580D4|nr:MULTISPECIES: IclR family transcriptional regulator [unclassified Brevibacterium]MCM1011728.1 IclR family transcriptional regulator [Brevibacterium sp. XM4083]
MRHPAEQDSPIAVVDRIASIVNCVAADDAPVSISEVARRTGLPKSTTSRIVNSLLPHGLLEMEDDGLVLGLRFFELGEVASRPRNLRRLTHAHLERLRHATGQTVHLAVLDGAHVVYIEIRRSRRIPHLPSRVGGRLPAHATGVGKVLLAHSPPSVAEALIDSGLERVGPCTIVDGDRLRAELWRVRSQGVAIEREESGEGVACVAAPIMVRGGEEPIAALSVSGALAEMDLEACERRLRETVTALNAQAARLPSSWRML